MTLSHHGYVRAYSFRSDDDGDDDDDDDCEDDHGYVRAVEARAANW